MNNFVVISSDSSPPSSPFGYAPVNRVSDLCGDDSRPSTPLPDSGFSNSYPSQEVDDARASAGQQVSPLGSPAREASPVKNKYGGRYNFHFISDSEDEGTGEGADGLDFSDETNVQCLQFDKKENVVKENRNVSKEQRKELKAKEKAEKAALLEKYRQMKPGECLKYVTVNVDIHLLDIEMCSKAIDLLKQQGIINCKITRENESNCITWSRNVPGSNDSQEKDENFILYVWSHERLITSIKYCTLIETFMAVTKTNPDLKISVVIYGLGNYYRKMKKLKKPENHLDPLETQNRKVRKRKSDESSISRCLVQ